LRARSVLSCPTAVELRRDARPVDLGEALLGLGDDAGRPTLTCPADSVLLLAAARREVVSVHLTGGPPSHPAGTATADPARADQLHLTGRLELSGTDPCHGCAEEHRMVVLQPSAVVLTVAGRATPVPVADFLAEEHALNPGFLQRAVEHANVSHGEELRRAAARRSGQPPQRLLAASLASLTLTGVELHWLDVEGAYCEQLRFPSPATTPAELGELLRRHLDDALC
jgi:hypothetical protein